ncbi:MAG: AAA family ATPase, partial [Candidatus Omnitrophota bacterium]
PFSTSPDPQFFYLTKEHDMALTSILIELRLRRGLAVILGDIGTGKTTLSRKLLQELRDRGNIIFHMILNPDFETEEQFLTSLLRNFNIDFPSSPDASASLDKIKILDLRDAVERFLIQKSEERQTIILIVDEAQKLNLVTLEVLRVLLNFETNEYKLIQLVLLGQLELYSKIVAIPNFIDRVSFKYTLNPLDIQETKELINFRIRQAGYEGGMQLFDDEAMSEIYNYARGYPRHITMLCHKALKELILQNKEVVDRKIIQDLLEKEQKVGWGRAENFRRAGHPIG